MQEVAELAMVTLLVRYKTDISKSVSFSKLKEKRELKEESRRWGTSKRISEPQEGRISQIKN